MTHPQSSPAAWHERARFLRVKAMLSLMLTAAALPSVAHAAPAAAPAPIPAPAHAPVPAARADDTPVARGRYLAVISDCAACHTNPGGAAFAGGYPIQSPLGIIYSSNITPSKTAGIGALSRDDFARAVQQGIGKDGAHLYPAMPYTSYARLSSGDIDDLYAYFMQAVKPVDTPARATKLGFPFNIRLSMAGWNALFLDSKPFTPDPAQSAQVNRGRYLVEGPAHCDMCHAPRNLLMATKSGGMTGGAVGAWYAPNITSDKVSGIGGWSDAELAAYLKTGIASDGHTDKARAAGPMAEAVQNSFQHMSDDDITAIIAYLRSLPAVATPGQTAANFIHGSPGTDVETVRGSRPMGHELTETEGAHLYVAACASCHQADGSGSADKSYPALFHNTTTGQPNPTDLIAAILFGVEREVGGHTVKMPGFGADSLVQRLSDEQIAALANHVLAQFGNAAAHVSPGDVATVRAGGPAAPIALAGNPFVLGFALLVALGLMVLARRKLRARAA
ncbi:cytochrome c [Novosphingobium terrae]|uniref:cytochrome c n=1 Tax=Novosphingobium terrae TaxID=2726189 RepID=UPI001F13F247|nr:cytochrome c [Novosphingobium terrae]